MKNRSLSWQLLRSVLVIYILITILITSVHIFITYNNSKKNIQSELQNIGNIFEPSLKSAIWHLDEEQIVSVGKSILNMTEIYAVEIRSKENKVLYSEQQLAFEKNEKSEFVHSFDLIYSYNKEDILLAKVTLYSSSELILQMSQVDFFLLILNAMIKSIALVVLFFIVFKNYLKTPLSELLSQVSKIKEKEQIKNKLNVQFEEKNELSLLQDRFNELIEYIKSEEQLKLDLVNSQKEKLEIEVAKRTEELSKTITQLKAKDVMLQQQTRLAALGEMIGNIAHQWRQPLSVITTASSGLQMKKEYGFLEDKDIDNTNNLILKNADFLSKTIDNFRNFFQFDNSQKTLFDVKKSIENTAEIVRASYDNHFIKLDLNLQENIITFGNENLFSQIVLNILSNAKDALLQNNIENKKVLIKLVQDKNKIIVKIRDNAKGIPKDIINKVFDPYFTTKHKSQGTGLGLYMSMQIIQTHFSGTLFVSNYQTIEDTGACFEITFLQQKQS